MMANYYVVAKTGTGVAPRTAIRPNIPSGVPWVGMPVGATYLIRTEVPLPAGHGAQEKQPLPDDALLNACNAHGAVYSDVTQRWRTG